ncbi:MAG: alpha/beta hydrolase [Chitinophagales bacterium]
MDFVILQQTSSKMTTFKRILVLFVLLIVAAYGYISWTLSNQILFPNSSMELTKSRIKNNWGKDFNAIMDSLPTPKDFAVTSFDGIQIKGKYFQKSDITNCAIILAHGWTDTWAGSLKYVSVLEDCQCDLVFYDHRAHGDSEGTYATGSINESKDLLALTEWVQKEKNLTAKQIGWLGASWGAAAVLTAGADSKNVAFIIADAPFQDWYSAIFERANRDYGTIASILSAGVMGVVNWRAGVDYTQASIVEAASKIEEPVLLIHSQADSETNSQQSVNISKKLKPNNFTFHHLDWGNDHTRDVLFNTEEYKGLVNEFLKGVEGDFLRE